MHLGIRLDSKAFENDLGLLHHILELVGFLLCGNVGYGDQDFVEVTTLCDNERERIGKKKKKVRLWAMKQP